jgi:hypothetical protein
MHCVLIIVGCHPAAINQSVLITFRELMIPAFTVSSLSENCECPPMHCVLVITGCYQSLLSVGLYERDELDWNSWLIRILLYQKD